MFIFLPTKQLKKDTVHEYNAKLNKGSGFVFEPFYSEPFLNALRRALRLYRQDEAAYLRLRENASKACIDVGDVTRAYAQEFYRMCKKNFLDKPLIAQMLEN